MVNFLLSYVWSSCSYTLSMINSDTKARPHSPFSPNTTVKSLRNFISLAWAIENTSSLASNQRTEMETQQRRVNRNEDLICKMWHFFHIFFCSFLSYCQRKDKCVSSELQGERCCRNLSVFLSGHRGTSLTCKTCVFISVLFLLMGKV